MTAYADARSTIATALDAALADWSVYDHPTDRLDPKSVGIAIGPSTRVNRNLWNRELTVGMFVSRATVAESHDLLDTGVPVAVLAIADAGGTVPHVSDPRVVTINQVDYLAQMIAVTMQTTN